MPIKADKLFLQLAEKAGIPATDQKLVDLLSNTQLNLIDVSEEFVNSLESNLLSIEDAKNNHPKIKTHYFAEVMSNVDRSLEKIYDDFEFTDEEKTELAKERSSTKRIGLVAAKLKERGETAVTEAGKSGGKNVQQYLQTINELNGQLAAIKTEKKNLEKTHAEELQTFKQDTALTNKIAGVKGTVYDDLPPDVRTMTVKQLLTKELQDNDIQFYLDEQGNLKLQKKDGSNYFDDNNRQPNIDEFVQKTLAKNKVLKQTPAPPKPGEPQNGQPTVIVDGKTKQGGYSMKGLIDESIASLDNANPMAVMHAP